MNDDEENGLSARTHRLLDVVDEAHAALTYEEREAIADALRADMEGEGPMSPRARAFLVRISDQLREIECEEGRGPAWFPTRQMVWEDLIEPRGAKRPEEMSADELEHEIERHRKYHPDPGEGQ
ncbi:MAG TPA: hypothetical protein VFV91_05875 [Gaiellaceae bacterium]|nr:hypothetical protein [Gaiellaceae bacterium]